MPRPNVLLCLADDAGMHMGAYGCNWVRTPGFDRVAAEGVLFTRAYTCNAKCAPSRASILTGRNSWQLDDACNHNCRFPAKFTTYMQGLREHGYHVGHTAKGWAPGDPGEVDGKPRELTGPGWNERELDPPTPHISSCDYAENFRDFLDDRPEDAPVCFWFGCREPHRGYEYGSGRRLGGHSIDEIDRVPGIWPDNETVRNDLLDYGFEIEHFDRHVQGMLDILEERGELDNTIVVVTSDNGMPFPRAKGQEYEYSNHLPMAIMWRDGLSKPGRTLDDYVCFIDLAPTFLELAGLTAHEAGMQPITGRSLVDLLRSEEEGTIDPSRDHVLIGKEFHDVGRPGNVGYPIRGIFKGGWLYLRNYETDRWPAGNPETGYLNCDGSPTKTEILKTRKDPEQRHYWELSFGKRRSEELYHVAEDPDCLENLADEAAHADRKAELRVQMERELEEQGDPRMEGRGEVFEQYPQHHRWLRDFYERFVNRHETGEEIMPGWVNESDIEPIEEFRQEDGR
jgi:arylsulfatase A-like enzyme